MSNGKGEDEPRTRPLGEGEAVLLDAYVHVFDTPDGELVIRHLQSLFVMPADSEVVRNYFGDVPHPYLAYMQKGAAVLADHIRTMTETGKAVSFERNVRLSDPQMIDEDLDP